LCSVMQSNSPGWSVIATVIDCDGKGDLLRVGSGEMT
jgi:hypothetical protein